MKFKAVVLVLAVLMLSSCIRIDSGKVLPTVGEQLVDLVKARELGAITEEEFERMKREVLFSLTQ